MSAGLINSVMLYLICRKKPMDARVNCWFCNQDTVVPYGNRNCWDCPNCDQYNGFQEVNLTNVGYMLIIVIVCQKAVVNLYIISFQNGDYNKPIPAQYMEDLNHGVSGSLPTSVPPNTLQWVNSQMLLCKKCNKNQSAKIKQLASFIPRDDVCILLFSIYYFTLFIVTMSEVC